MQNLGQLGPWNRVFPPSFCGLMQSVDCNQKVSINE